ncbi:hypothetical protein [Actinoplanes sp. M2I2]|uniref:hypothetical protein n=1 Tax=Actinoplanes sp. M2I2 TaxID=1734444 RepID=UPI00202144B9|nr:hypothetical protein [Actinoplanes sp. M2I2]
MTGDGASRAGRASNAMYGHVEERDGVVVQFMLGGEDASDTVDNVDAHIYLPDGTHRYATFFTTEAINALLRKWARTGETGGGRYFWCSDQVVVPRPGVPAMMEAVTEMIRSGDITFMCGLVDDGPDEEGQSEDPAPSA